MNADMGHKLTLLGLGAVVFYGVLFATDLASLEVMPQFLVSALVFIGSGRMSRLLGAQRLEEDEDDDEAVELRQPAASEADWARLTQVFNWLAVFVVITVLALWVVKPQGTTLADYVQDTFVNHQVYDQLLSP